MMLLTNNQTELVLEALKAFKTNDPDKAKAIEAEITRFEAAIVEQTSDVLTVYRDEAKRRAVEGELEVDDEAIVSMAEESPRGAYVQAWVWVDKEDVASDLAFVGGEDES
ncbi:MAG: hypothetical protein JSS66_05895 [Armatimonadetes bacterium]|nr:hypothetical protein [Armatimonadota bacterium]